MANLLYQQIEMLSREKHIEPEIVVSAIEDAMVVAARKYYKTEENLRGKFNAESGQVDVFSVLTVVEEVADPKMEISLADAKKKNPTAEVGTEILTAKPTDVLGRIAAQTAKQVILQKVREAERDTIYNEYLVAGVDSHWVKVIHRSESLFGGPNCRLAPGSVMNLARISLINTLRQPGIIF